MIFRYSQISYHIVERINKPVLQYSGFYYEATAISLDNSRFSRTGTQWVIDRIVKGKADKFRAASNLVEKKKRTIIVSDFSLNLIEKEDLLKPVRESIACLIKTLIIYDFTVKIWDGKQLINVTDDSELNWPQLAPIGQRDLEKLNEQFTTPVYHLNYFSTRALLRELEIWPFKANDIMMQGEVLYTDDLFDIIGKPSSVKLFDWLNQLPAFELYYRFDKNQTGLEKTHVNELMAHYSEKINGIHLFSCPREVDLEMLNNIASLPNLMALSGDLSSYLEKILLHKGSVLSSLRELRADSIPSKLLNDYIKSNKQLSRLAISNLDEGEGQAITTLPSQLQSLTLSGMTSADAAHIMNLAPPSLEELVVIKISDAYEFSSELITNEAVFRNLQRFIVTEYDSNSETRKMPGMCLDALLKIHAVASKITTIVFNQDDFSLYNSSTLNNIKDLSLPHITSIETINCNIYKCEIAAMLQATPYISQLTIKDCTILPSRDSFTLPDNLNFPQLNKLILDGVGSEMSTAIVSAAKNLVSLQVEALGEVNQSFQKLSQFSCKEMQFKDYCELLAHAPRMTTFDLSIIVDLPDTKPAPLPHIRRLIVSSNRDQLACLHTALSILPNLEKICSKKPMTADTDVVFLSPEHIPDSLALKSLKEVELNHIAVKATAMAKLFQAVKQKIQLNLYHDQSLADWAPGLIPENIILQATISSPPLETYLRSASLNTGHINLNSWKHFSNYHISEALNLATIQELSSSMTENLQVCLQLLVKCKSLIKLKIKHALDLSHCKHDIHLPQLLNAQLSEVTPQTVAWLEDAAPNLVKLDIEGIKANQADKASLVCINKGFARLQKLEMCRVDIHATSIERLLDQSPVLNTLVMDSIIPTNDLFKNLLENHKMYPCITILRLAHQQLSNQFILQIRRVFPNLQHLSLNNCTGLSDCPETDVEELTHWPVTAIHIKKCDVNEAAVRQLLLKAEKLVTVSLETCRTLRQLNFLPDEISLLTRSLFYFDISSHLHDDDQKILLNAAVLRWLCLLNVSMTELSLNGCDIQSPPDCPMSDSQGRLQKLSLCKSQLDFDFFSSVLAYNSSSLFNINISRTSFNFGNHLGNEKNQSQRLPGHIDWFDSSNSNLPLSYFLAIFRQIKNHQYTPLSKFKSDSAPAIRLPDLKNDARELIINTCTLSLSDFYTVLLNTPLVISMEIESSSILQMASDEDQQLTDFYKRLDLTHLRELRLLNAYCTLLTLIVLLAKAPNLDKLDLTGLVITDYDDRFLPANLCLSKLKYIKLSDDCLEFILFEKLANFAPALATINNKLLCLSSTWKQRKQSILQHQRIPRPSRYIPRHELTDLSKDAAADPDPGKGDKVSSEQLFFPCHEHSLLNDTRKYRLIIAHDLRFDGKKIIPVILNINDENEYKFLNKVSVPQVDSNALMETFTARSKKDPHQYKLFDNELYITKQWRRIPSYLAGEKMLLFFTDYPHQYQIKYCKKDQQYWIRGEKATNKRSKAKFIVKLNYPEGDLVISGDAYKLYKRCKNFSQPQAGEIPPDTFLAEQTLDWRYSHQVGSCENRMLVFFNIMKRMGWLKKYPCRMVWNDPHAFIEMNTFGNVFTMLELGGYPLPFEFPTIPDKPKIALPPPQAAYALKPVDEDSSSEESGSETSEESSHEVTSSASEDDSWSEAEDNSDQEPVPVPMEARILGMEEDNSLTGLLVKDSEPRVDLPTAAFVAPSAKITEESLHPALISWRNTAEPVKQLKETIFADITGPGKNSLIKIEKSDDFQRFVASFAKSNHAKTPFLVIDSADDLQWSTAGLKMATSGKISIEQKFSRLRDFVNKNPSGILFINWSRFTATDIVALHSILDENRKLEGEDFPVSNPIVGVYNTKLPQAYRGSDLYSRLHYNIPWQFPFTADLFDGRRKASAIPDKQAFVKNLYNSDDWEALLFGLIHIKDQHFTLQQTGMLETDENGILKINHLHLLNAPWQLREFQLFWQSALLQGFFVLYGKQYNLSEHFKLSYSERYDFNLALFQKKSLADAPVFVLNSQTQPFLFEHHVLNEKNGIDNIKGFFEQQTGQIVTLQVTETMTASQWAQLLDEATSCNVKIALHTLPGVSLPLELRTVTRLELAESAKDTKGCDVIYAPCNSQQITQHLRQQFPDAIYVQLDQSHDFSDLFYRIDSKITADNTIFAKIVDSALWHELQKGATVIIEGEVPKSIQNMLAELFITGKQELVIQGKRIPFKGKLIFVTAKHIPCALHQLKAPESASDGIPVRPTTIAIQTVADNKELSLAACEAYENRRFDHLFSGLNQPYPVFYAGTTGIGKSTYMLKGSFENDYFTHTGHKATLYVGEANIEPYAAHNDPDSDALLIIDEANLSSQRLSFLKSWQAGHLLIDGHYYTRKPQHKSPVLIGNDKEYGGVRQQQEFFDEHTVRIECEKPCHAYLYHRVLKQYVDETSADIFLELYDHVNRHADKNQQIMTARHLTMIAKTYHVWLEQFKTSALSPAALAIAAGVAVMGDAIKPHVRDSILASINAKERYQYEADKVIKAQLVMTRQKLDALIQSREQQEDSFEFANSRLAVIQLLETHFLLHEQYPGEVDFGVLLEGESGIGKSEIVTHYAKLRGVELLQMTPGKNLDEDKKKLTDAKLSKRRVLMDEINAGGERLEQTVNTLATGFIATQNPSTMDGRCLLSPALRARFTLYKVSQYTEKELVNIIMRKCKIKKYGATLLANDFVSATHFAEQRQLSPKPNLRSFLKGISDGAIKPRVSKLIYDILYHFEFWQIQTVGPRCSIPEGISKMLRANSLDEIQAIARTRLSNNGYTFFSSLFRSSATTEFYKLILDPQEDKLKAFTSKQSNLIHERKQAEEWNTIYPPVHIMK